MASLAPGHEHEYVVWGAHDGRQRLFILAIHPARPEIFLIKDAVKLRRSGRRYKALAAQQPQVPD